MRQCDECGRQTKKLSRIYGGHRYCATCYARVFISRQCPACGRLARLPSCEADAVCRACERDRPCVRCGASDYKVGRITPYGPVCNACSVHFREARPCAICGQPSRRLSRVSRLSIKVQVCPKCQRKDYGSCALCKHYRLLGTDDLGRKVCRKCLEGGLQPCKHCGELMPAGRGDQCEPCYWSGLLGKRVVIGCEEFHVPGDAEWFRHFAKWLSTHVGVHKAARTINRYLPFFVDLAAMGQGNCNADELLRYFATKGLRHYELPLRFLAEAGIAEVSAQAKEEASDHRRIADLLNQFPKGGSARLLLESYHTHLLIKARAGTISTRSARLAMTPAAALLRLGVERKCIPPTQAVLLDYLSHTPGQRAAVSGFVCYLRYQHGLDMTLPATQKLNVVTKRKGVEAKLAKLLSRGTQSAKERRQALELALQYFHGLSGSVAQKVAGSAPVVEKSKGDWAILYDGRSYWLPAELSQVGVVLPFNNGPSLLLAKHP